MPLTIDDIQKIQALFKPLEDRFTKLELKMTQRFDVVDQNFDALFKRDETVQQENVVFTEQLSRLEKRVGALENKNY